MTPKQNAQYRDELRRMSDEIVQNAAAVEEQTCVSTGGQADGGLSNAPMHLADMGTDASIQETSSVILDNERYLLGEIDSALGRLDSGQFGSCETCGKPIGNERLEAIPYARNCMTCTRAQEEDSQSNSRRANDDDRFALDEKRVDRQDLGGERGAVAFTDIESDEGVGHGDPDIHAAGTAGGGTAVGGLAGTNIGRGNPRGNDLERATGSGQFDAEDGLTEDGLSPIAGHSGGAVGGTPTGKRSGPVGKSGSKGQRPRKRRES